MSSVGGRTSTSSPRVIPESTDTREMDLFRRAQTGDRGAFGQLAIRLQDRLYNAILRVIGDREEARELTQEVFVKALTKIESFRGESQPATWMFRIGINLAISHLRKNRRHRSFSLDASRNGTQDQASALLGQLKSPGLSPDQVIQERETHQQVLTALGQLDAEYRAILVMRDIENMDYQQIADVLNIPLGTLKSKLFRARLALREQMILLNTKPETTNRPSGS
ncbi:MAG: hypothetical protein KatS3mg104_0257 [Phycisphaerae bacterium]|nr:MAG: hypothetical protein KatS3mg104_0257 [Phycisphaerae bacterium]